MQQGTLCISYGYVWPVNDTIYISCNKPCQKVETYALMLHT